MNTSQRIFFYVVTMVILSSLTSCISKKTESKQEATDSLKSYRRQAELIYQKGIMDTTIYLKYINKVKDYAVLYPKETFIPDMYYNAAVYDMVMADMNMKNMDLKVRYGQDAIKIFSLIIENYPTYIELSMCYYNRAVVYDNILGRYTEADKAYREFMAKYPAHEFVPNLEIYIQQLGKSPEQIMNDFEKNNSKSSDNPIVENVKAL